jgi:hypothetical protein
MKRLLFIAAAVVILAGSMLADTVVCPACVGGTSSPFPANFSSLTAPFTTLNPGPAAPVFWNNPSDDTGILPSQSGNHMMNIGYVLTDSGGVTGTTPVLGSDTVTSDFVATGGADPSAFAFVRNATAYNIVMLFADSSEDTGGNPIAGVQGSQFGYYVGMTQTPLYNVGLTLSPNSSQAFNPGPVGTQYGFYETICYAASAGVCTDYETYTSGNGNSGIDNGGASWNHFAVFQLASGSYVIGFTGQNGLYGENIGDYQDTVIELQVASLIAPEPGTIAMMGLGLAALGVLGRRRFARK